MLSIDIPFVILSSLSEESSFYWRYSQKKLIILSAMAFEKEEDIQEMHRNFTRKTPRTLTEYYGKYLLR